MPRFLVLALTCLLPGCLAAQNAVPRPIAPTSPFKAAWIASVFNINFPSKAGLTAEQQQQELTNLIELAKRSGLNALIFQVRPEGDALYRSPREPWSRFLTGTQGRDPGYDPLAFLIAEGAKRGIAIHAWVNPYRAAVDYTKPLTSNHMARRFPAYAYRIDNTLWMDPGSREVQDLIIQVFDDLMKRYPGLVGIHIDDYFYPYPKNWKKPVRFPDDKTYAAYQSSGGRLSKEDWRRQNVNQMVRRMYQTVKSNNPNAMFGISPFGTYTKGAHPANIEVHLDQYHHLYADPVLWLREGWCDYMAPQLYWRDGGPQCFSTLLRWWRSPEINPRRIPIVPGIALDRLGGSHNWPVSEITTQLTHAHQIGPGAGLGFAFWNIKGLQERPAQAIQWGRTH
ncbi:MAG: hypothetical protein OHK005_07130 [Candidatus Methylacidiphilales bacterium]